MEIHADNSEIVKALYGTLADGKPYENMTIEDTVEIFIAVANDEKVKELIRETSSEHVKSLLIAGRRTDECFCADCHM